MGTTISTNHDPQQYKFVKDAEQACYEYFGGVKLQEEWVTIDHSAIENKDDVSDLVWNPQSLLAHVKRIRCLKLLLSSSSRPSNRGDHKYDRKTSAPSNSPDNTDRSNDFTVESANKTTDDRENQNHKGHINRHCSRKVLLIHGGGGEAADWAPLLSQLLEHQKYQDQLSNEYEFWIFDRPGHGQADPFDYLKHIPTPCSASAPMMDLFHVAIIDQIRQHMLSGMVAGDATDQDAAKIDIVGNSMGGLIGYYFAKHRPQYTRSLTWIGSPAFFDGQAMPIPRLLPFLFDTWITSAIASLFARSAPKIIPKTLLTSTFHHPSSSIGDCMIHLMCETMKLRNNALSSVSLFRCVLSNLHSYKFALESLTMTPLLKDVPKYLIVGCNEPFMRPLSKHLPRFEKHLGGKSNVIVKGIGHLPWLDDPSGVAESLFQFLERQK